jgi:phosphatidylglycerol---prolipoprotein diacylglyceryl transferase
MSATPIIHHPFSVSLGPLEFTGFGFAVLLGFVISQIIAERELTRRGHDPSPIGDVVFAAVLGTLVGAKLYYVLVITHDIRDFFSRGGFVFWGGFIGAVALCWLVIRYKKLPFTRISDVAGISIAAGYAVGRTGCWAVGDDYGRPWNSRFAVAFPEGAPPSTVANMSQLFGIQFPPGTPPTQVVAVHPTQLYETAMGFLMFWALWRLRGHRHAEGWLFGLYCVLAGAERFVVEFFRAKDDRFFGPLTTAQLIALAIAAAGALVMNARRSVRPGRPGILAPGSAPASAARAT